MEMFFLLREQKTYGHHKDDKSGRAFIVSGLEKGGEWGTNHNEKKRHLSTHNGAMYIYTYRHV